MKKLRIAADRFGDAGDVRKAYAVGKLQLDDPAPIVPFIEAEGARRYVVTSLGMGSADAYELRLVAPSAVERKSPAAGEWTGRRVTCRGVGYVLGLRVKLIAEEAPAPENAAVPDSNGAGESVGFSADYVAQAENVVGKVAQMKADVDAQVAAARARVEAATPEQLAQKRTPLPAVSEDRCRECGGIVPRGRELCRRHQREERMRRPLPEVNPAHWGAKVPQVTGGDAREPVPELVQANLALDAAALDATATPYADMVVEAPQAPTDEDLLRAGQFPVEVDEAGQFDAHAYTAKVRARIAALRQNDTETHQTPATEPEEASAPSDSPPAPRPRLVPVDRYPYDEVPVGWLVPSPHNPRAPLADDDPALQELKASIAELGVLQPLRVRRLPGQEPLCEIVAGYRRWRAAMLAGRLSVPVVLSDAQTEAEVRVEQLVENLQREDLNAIEIALAYQQMAGLGLTQAEIGRMVGLAQPTVRNTLALLELPPDVQAMVVRGELSATKARALGRFREDPELQRAIAQLSAETGDPERATVRYLESTPLPFKAELQAAGIIPGRVLVAPIPRAGDPEPEDGAPLWVLPVREEAGAKGGAARLKKPPAPDPEADGRFEQRHERADELRPRVYRALAEDEDEGFPGPRALALVIATAARHLPALEILQPLARRMKLGLPEGDWALRTDPALLDAFAGLTPETALDFLVRAIVETELAALDNANQTPRLCEWLVGDAAATERAEAAA